MPRHPLLRLLSLVVALATLTGCALSDGLQAGVPAPELMVDGWVNTPAGAAPSVAANRGKHVLVEFWSMHCPYCLDKIPEMQEITQRYCCTELEVLTVHVPLGDHDDSAEEIAAFAQKAQLPFPVAVDSTGTTLAHYECGYLPHGVLIGPDGRVVWAGSMSMYDIGDRVREALETGEDGTVATARAALRDDELPSGVVPAGLSLDHAPPCRDPGCDAAHP